MSPTTPPLAESMPSTEALAGRPPYLRLALMGLFVIGMLLAYALLPLTEWLSDVARVLRDFGPFGILLYVGAYTAGSLFLFPAAVLSLTAGFAWGIAGGFVIAIVAATAAACSAFLVGRYVFRGRLRRVLMEKPKLSAVERAINGKGARLVFLLRFSPVLPFPILNYVLGMTRIPFPGFAGATAVGLMPITLMYAYLGSIGAQLGGLDGGAADVGPMKIIVAVVGVLVTIGITVWVGKAARQALREVETETAPQPF